MKRDQWIGLVIAAGSIVTAIVLNVILLLEEAGFKLEVFILPALGFLIGVLMIFTNIESTIGVKEIIDELPESLRDDADTLKTGQITFPIVACMISICAFFAEGWLILHFHKWNAEWYGVRVLAISTIVVIVTVWLCFRSDWFTDRFYRLSRRVFIIPAVGFAICAALGTYYAEPPNFGELSPMQKDQLTQSDSYFESSRGNQIFYAMGQSSDSSGISDIDCDGDECLGLLLIVVVIVCVIGSALIPHFWLLATMVLLTIMIMVSVRELLFYDSLASWKKWR